MIKMNKSIREELEKTVVYINGDYCSGIDAKISIFDTGFTRGATIFDAISLSDGFLIKLDSHLRRFYEGMHAHNIEIPQSKEELKEIQFETVRRSKLKDGLVYATATFGIFPVTEIDGKWGGADWEPTLMVWCRPEYQFLVHFRTAIPGPEEVGHKAITPRTRNYPIQCVDSETKNWNRLNHYLALMELRGTGADEVIMMDMDGYIREGTGSNIWIVKDGKLFTPAGNILYGITREVVFDIAKLENIEASQANIASFDLYNADEVFFSSSAGGIKHIIEVNKIRIGDGKLGPITRRIWEAYWKMHVDPKYATKVPGLEKEKTEW